MAPIYSESDMMFLLMSTLTSTIPSFLLGWSKMQRPVRVQSTTVSMNTSAIPRHPCAAGDGFPEEE